MGPIRAVDHVEGKGRALYTSVRELGLEGVVAKRAQSAYRSGRFGDWQKVRADRVGDFAVVGFTKAEGSRTGFGSVHVAVQKEEGLVYVGKVGGGFSEKELTSARAEMEALAPAEASLHRTASPRIRAYVGAAEAGGRGPVQGDHRGGACCASRRSCAFRTDKAPEECVSPDAPRFRSRPARCRSATWRSLLARGGLHQGRSDRVLPRHRPLAAPVPARPARGADAVSRRIAGKSFFQKDAPDYVPPWIRTARVWSEGGRRDIDFFVCEDVDTLLYVINLGTIPLHLWSSRLSRPQHPDWCIIDLDPKTAPFSDVVTLANAVHELCEEIGLPSFCKTSGQKGCTCCCRSAGSSRTGSPRRSRS